MSHRILEKTGPQAMGVVGNVMVVYGVQPPPTPLIARIQTQLLALARQHPEGIALLQVIAPPENIGLRRLPLDGMQEAMSKLLDATGEHLRALVVVINRQGFIGAAIRSLIAGVMLLSRKRVHAKFVPSVKEGVSLLHATLVERAVSAPTEAEIQALTDELASLCKPTEIPQSAS